MNINKIEANQYVYEALDNILDLNDPYIDVTIDDDNDISFTIYGEKYINGEARVLTEDISRHEYIELLKLGLSLKGYNAISVYSYITDNELFFYLNMELKKEKSSNLSLRKN